MVLGMVLAFGGLRPGWEVLRQALGVRGLLQAGAGLSSEELANPFVCLRAAGNTTLAQKALLNVSDGYMQGVGLCLAGEDEAGLTALKEAGWQSNAEVQYTVGSNEVDPQARVNAVAELELDNNELIAVMQKLSTQPDVEPYPALRFLAQLAPSQPETWRLWLQGSSRLEQANKWQAALDWLSEGMVIAPTVVRSSLDQRVGWIYQTQSEPRDYQTALVFYNRALDEGGWLYPDDEVITHIHRGEIYRALSDVFSPNIALEEFNTALMLQPGNYWALLDIGHVYLYDLNDLDQAETYYRQALAADEQTAYTYFYIGEVYRARGDNGSAVDWYQQALERQPDWQPAMDRVKELEGK
jgi:tetratricopeptide (TPR) repeat protein